MLKGHLLAKLSGELKQEVCCLQVADDQHFVEIGGDPMT